MGKSVLCVLLPGLILIQAGCATTGRTAANSSSSDANFVSASSNDSFPSDNSVSDSAAIIQQINDINALNASIAAAEQQNEAAQQQTLQTEINAMPINNSNQW